MSNALEKAIVFGASSDLGQSISLSLDKFFVTTRASTSFLKLLCSDFSYLSASSSTLAQLNINLQANRVIVFNQALTVLSDVLSLGRDQVFDSFAVNAIFPFEVIKYILSVSSNFHRFIFISSIAGSCRSESASVAYSASKRAIHGLVKHLSLEKGDQCDFVAIAPSQIDSSSLRANLTSTQLSMFQSKNPTKSLCTTAEISYLVTCIANYPGRHINGAIIDLNGGLF